MFVCFFDTLNVTILDWALASVFIIVIVGATTTRFECGSGAISIGISISSMTDGTNFPMVKIQLLSMRMWCWRCCS